MDSTTTDPATLSPITRSSATPLPCQPCGVLDVPDVGPGHGPQSASAMCRHWGRSLQWLSPRSPEEREARRREALSKYPPSSGQLRFLHRLGYRGPTPATMAQASELIDQLLEEPRR